MIERTHHGYCVDCDFCSTEIEIGADGRHGLQERLIELGWQVEAGSRGEAIHRCPCCVEDQQPNEKANGGG